MAIIHSSSSLSEHSVLNIGKLLWSNLWISSLLLLTIVITYLSLTSLLERHRIRRLGSPAPAVSSYLPFGIDVVFRHIVCTLRNEDLVFWSWLFAQNPHKDSPTVETTAARQRYIFTADPDNIKAVLATQFQDYGKGKAFHNDWKAFLGDGIFNSDGEIWHANRQLLRPQFVKTRISDLDLFENHVQNLITKFGQQGERFDVAELFYRFTLDVATEFLCGESVGHLDNPEAVLAKAFNHISRMQSLTTRLGPFSKLLPKFTLRRSLRVIDAFVEPFIDGLLSSNTEKSKQTSSQDHSFLHALAATGVRDRKVIRDQFVNILLAGRDTTAAILSFLFLELSWHPEILTKLRNEILEMVGEDARPTYQDLKDMPYLKHTINEVLRLYPVLPYNIRWSLHDTTLPTGGGPDGKQPIGVPKNTAIAYSTLCMQRREDLYPADTPHPHEFNPDRWQHWFPQSWQYLPFNGGPRICLGQQFALTEISYTVIRILQRYAKIDAYSSMEGPRYKTQVVMCPVDGVKIGLSKASSSE